MPIPITGHGRSDRVQHVPIDTVVNQKGKPVELRLETAYAPGLLGLDTWSHVERPFGRT